MNLQFFAPRTQQLSSVDYATPSNSHQMLEKSLLQIAKLHLEMAEESSITFALLPHSLDLIKAYWDIIKNVAQTFGAEVSNSAKLGTDGDAADDSSPLIEQLALKGFLIIRACLRIISDPRSIRIRSDQDIAEKEEALRRLQDGVFTPQFVQEVLALVVNRFFVFRSSDLRRWEDEPDEWEAQEGGDTEGFRYSLRLTAEKVFLDLVNKYTESVVPDILRMISIVTSTQVDVPQKESAYTALGLAADKISVYSQTQSSPYDFNQTLSVLVSDIQNQEPGYRLIRRRISILLGKWVHIQIAKENRVIVYQIFLHLLDKEQTLNDLVVRVTTGRQFKEIVADWEFEAAPFLQFAPDMLSRLMHLIAEVELPETKMGLLETISALVENLGPHVRPPLQSLLSFSQSLD